MYILLLNNRAASFVVNVVKIVIYKLNKDPAGLHNLLYLSIVHLVILNELVRPRSEHNFVMHVINELFIACDYRSYCYH